MFSRVGVYFANFFALALASSMIGCSFFFSAGFNLKGFLEIGVGFFVLLLIDTDEAAIDVGVGVFRLQANHFGEVARGEIMLVDAQVGQTAIERRLGVLWVQPHRFAVVVDGGVEFAELALGQAAIVKGFGDSWD